MIYNIFMRVSIDCKDKVPNCIEQLRLGDYCNHNVAFIKQFFHEQCPKSCGLCKRVNRYTILKWLGQDKQKVSRLIFTLIFIFVSGDCTDTSSMCHKYATPKRCKKDPLILKLCPKTCCACGKSNESWRLFVS